MDLKFAMLADHVTHTHDGKLVIVGDFHIIWSTSEPPVHYGPFFLVARFEASISEGSTHRFTACVVDEDGQIVQPKFPELPVTFAPMGRGHPLSSRVIMKMPLMKFPLFGVYDFHLLLDGHLMGQVPLTVTRLETRDVASG